MIVKRNIKNRTSYLSHFFWHKLVDKIDATLYCDPWELNASGDQVELALSHNLTLNLTWPILAGNETSNSVHGVRPLLPSSSDIQVCGLLYWPDGSDGAREKGPWSEWFYGEYLRESAPDCCFHTRHHKYQWGNRLQQWVGTNRFRTNLRICDCAWTNLISQLLPALISIYSIRNPSLRFSEPKAAYLAGVYWTTSTSSRVFSVLLLMVIGVKQLLVISHVLCFCASGEL